MGDQPVAGKYEGKLNIALGVTKQKLGQLTGNKKLQREGQFQKLKGATQDATEGAKVAVKNTGKTIEKELNRGLQHIRSKIKP
ncbi:CsbD family protein [Limnobacter parvus]|uniref:CsbD family protein n=1 Tax=Limnobacter parvus TaxID=2939690 RepID=A0ABT1XEV3_9BURK|nr:CsbD family protein [Limnobacter parvus]MCR2745805.1 CsbD family protein [Limnobacter parvus]